MAIQPLDLQVMYSQMSNVSKIAAHQQKGDELTNAMQQNKIVQQNSEQVASVQKAASEEAKSMNIKPDGGQGSNFLPGKRQGGKKESEQPEEKKEIEIRESYLGQHIDISG